MTGIKPERFRHWSFISLFSQTNGLKDLTRRKFNAGLLSEVKGSTLGSNNYRLITDDFDVSHITVT